LSVQLGPHAGFILAAYGAAGIMVLSLLVWVIVDYRAQRRALAELDRQGVSRRATRVEELA
jgi:heme exporter protein D